MANFSADEVCRAITKTLEDFHIPYQVTDYPAEVRFRINGQAYALPYGRVTNGRGRVLRQKMLETRAFLRRHGIHTQPGIHTRWVSEPAAPPSAPLPQPPDLQLSAAAEPAPELTTAPVSAIASTTGSVSDTEPVLSAPELSAPDELAGQPTPSGQSSPVGEPEPAMPHPTEPVFVSASSEPPIEPPDMSSSNNSTPSVAPTPSLAAAPEPSRPATATPPPMVRPTVMVTQIDDPIDHVGQAAQYVAKPDQFYALQLASDLLVEKGRVLVLNITRHELFVISPNIVPRFLVPAAAFDVAANATAMQPMPAPPAPVARAPSEPPVTSQPVPAPEPVTEPVTELAPEPEPGPRPEPDEPGPEPDEPGPEPDELEPEPDEPEPEPVTERKPKPESWHYPKPAGEPPVRPGAPPLGRPPERPGTVRFPAPAAAGSVGLPPRSGPVAAVRPPPYQQPHPVAAHGSLSPRSTIKMNGLTPSWNRIMLGILKLYLDTDQVNVSVGDLANLLKGYITAGALYNTCPFLIENNMLSKPKPGFVAATNRGIQAVMKNGAFGFEHPGMVKPAWVEPALEQARQRFWR